jgi:uncharacterized protein (DUF488 family)
VTASLATIGYEQATQEALLAVLRAAGIGLLVDVRAIAASRRPGFAKRQLAAGLEGVGIGYLHLRALGTPAEGRLAARTGHHADMRRIYAAHLAGAPAQAALAELDGRLARGERLCLLCLERQPEHCHRGLVADALAERRDLRIEHLMV